MTIRNWVKFFFNALLIGGFVTAVAGLIVRWAFFSDLLAAGETLQFIGALLWMVFLGFTMSVVAQMGFFAYLTVHQFGVNIFKTLTLWNWVQLLIIAVVLFDLVFFRFRLTSEDTGRSLLYLTLLASLVIVSSITAYLKAQVDEKTYANICVVLYDCYHDARMVAGANGSVWKYRYVGDDTFIPITSSECVSNIGFAKVQYNVRY